MLQNYDRGASKHVYDIVKGGESWIYAYEPKSKQKSTVWVFQYKSNPTKGARARSTFKYMIACFFGKTGHVAIVPLEQRRTVNSEWYTTICLPVVFQEIRKTNRQRRIDHFSPRQCDLSHIGSNNCIFEHSFYNSSAL